jgi:hypothetical protein
MIIPDNIAEKVISFKDQYFDLRGLEVYSSIKVPTLRDHIKSGDLPCFKIKGKILIRRSEFDAWVEGYRVNRKQDLCHLVDDVMSSLKS